MSEIASVVSAVTARLCHDLAGQIGTVGGMLELAGEADAGEEPLALAAEAAGKAAGALRFARAAWGGAAEPMGGEAIAALAAGMAGAERLRADFSGVAGVWGAEAVQLALCAVAAAAAAMRQGGTVAVAGDARQIRVTLAGGVWPGGAGQAEPRGVPLFLLHAFAGAYGYAVETAGSVLTLTSSLAGSTRR